MPRYRRAYRPLPALVALLLALLVAPVGAASTPSPGNSAAAKACQDGGYAWYAGSDGTPFRSPGECVQFVAQGGSLASPLAPLTLTFAGWYARGTWVTVTGYTVGDTICIQGVNTADAPYDPANNPTCSVPTTTSSVTLPIPGGCYTTPWTMYAVARDVTTGQEGRTLITCP